MNLRDYFSIFSRRLDRLEHAITVYRYELEAGRVPDPLSEKNKEAISKALELLDLAKEATIKGELDKGWKCLQGAQRMELFTLDPENGLQAKIKVLREEASKLRAWRRDAIYELLGTAKHPVEVSDCYRVYSAALLRDEHYSNQAYKGTLNSIFNLRLASHLLAALGLIYWLICNGTIQFCGTIDYGSPDMYCSVAIFGLFGAIISAIIKQLDMTSGSSTIPEALIAWQVTELRIFGGAAFAFILFIFLKSEIISGVFSNDIADILISPSHFTVYAISFCAGFSERFVLRAVRAVGRVDSLQKS